MSKILSAIAIRFIKGHWGAIFPRIFKAAAEGEFGEPIKRAYWFSAGYRTVTGACLFGLGTALEAVCSNYPEFAWTCAASKYVYMAGAVLTTVGLVDGGTRAPWPEGTPKEEEK